jgi:NDP-sugar pyrophosphorylase family protein
MLDTLLLKDACMKVVMPMAGAGSRFAQQGYDMPKPLIRVNGITLVEHSIKSFDVDAEFIFVTRKFDNPDHNRELSQLLISLRPESVEIQLDALSNGASETCLAAQHLINNDQPLVIYNCDQIFQWDPQEFLKFVEQHQPDGAVVLYNSRDPKNSFAQIEQGCITRLVEKTPISDHALVGFHYWARGRDFVHSAQHLAHTFRFSGRPECYVSETYNVLLDNTNYSLAPYHISNAKFIPLGTPEDVNRYLGKISEFHSRKPHTIFCDIDGTILKHAHSISDVMTGTAQLLPAVQQKINQWDSQGHRIIFVTARKESARAITEQQLAELGLAWDQLIMGCTSGTRYLINDKLSMTDSDRAVSVNLQTDTGFEHLDWSKLGL